MGVNQSAPEEPKRKVARRSRQALRIEKTVLDDEDVFRAEYPDYDPYDQGIDALRRDEFAHVGKTIYLDHAGAALCSKRQADAIGEALQSSLFANPHSQGPIATSTREAVSRARQLTMAFFNAPADEYVLVFTAGATAGLKLVGECFPWTDASEFRMSEFSHNSVVGIREYAVEHGAAFSTFHTDEISPAEPPAPTGEANHLIAFPAECNFSGVRAPADLVERAQQGKLPNASPGRWWVCLDVAKYVGSAPLDLEAVRPDFCVISFYKMFGYPTGLGALFMRREAAELLQKRYFGGGTVQASLSRSRFHQPRADLSAWFADGTEDFTGIPFVSLGLEMLSGLGMARIAEHTWALTRFLYQSLMDMKHYNGSPVAVVYGNHAQLDPATQGPVVTFSILQPDGGHVGYAEVERLATMHRIQLRTGCFCNPGACQHFLHLSDQDVRDNLDAGHVCWDDMDLVNGRPTGAVRSSIGYMTNWKDIQSLLRFIKHYFCVTSAPPQVSVSTTTTTDKAATRKQRQAAGPVVLEAITVFPIKSCAGMQVDRWPLGPRGLLLDREWAVVDYEGKAIRQKMAPRLCLVTPRLDLTSRTLHISAPGQSDLVVPFEGSQEANAWFSEFLGVRCTLATSTKGFANQGNFLLLSQASVDALNDRLEGDPVPASRFRANLLVAGGIQAHEEDSWERIAVGSTEFHVVGPCSRCSMVNIDQNTADVAREPLLTLASYRRERANILFGQFLNAVAVDTDPMMQDDSIMWEGGAVLSVGSNVTVLASQAEK